MARYDCCALYRRGWVLACSQWGGGGLRRRSVHLHMVLCDVKCLVLIKIYSGEPSQRCQSRKQKGHPWFGPSRIAAKRSPLSAAIRQKSNPFSLPISRPCLDIPIPSPKQLSGPARRRSGQQLFVAKTLVCSLTPTTFAQGLAWAAALHICDGGRAKKDTFSGHETPFILEGLSCFFPGQITLVWLTLGHRRCSTLGTRDGTGSTTFKERATRHVHELVLT